MQNSDKGNSIVLINESDYLDKMYNNPLDSKRLVKSSILDDKHLNFIIEIKKKLTDLLTELKASEAISDIYYKKPQPRGSSFVILYGLCKSNKKILDKFPPFRPILWTIKTSCYNLAKPLVPLIKNSFEFFKEICEQNSEYCMTSLNVASIFIDIPLKETVKICCNSLYNNQNCCVLSAKISLRNF